MIDPWRSWRSLLLLLLGSVGYAAFLFVWFSVPAWLTPISSQFGLSDTAAGVLVGAVPLTYVPFALASGLVIDRIGSRYAIGIGLFGVGLAHLGRGLAQSFPALLGLTLVLGVAGTGITFGLPKLVSERFPAEWSGTMSGVYLMGLYAGTAIAFGPGRGYIGPALGGWRPLFVWSGGLTAVGALLWIVLAGWLGRREPKWEQPAGGSDVGRSFTAASIVRDVRRVLTHRELLLLVVIGTMYLFTTHGLQGWLTAILARRGFDPTVAASVTSWLIIAQVAGTAVIPPLSDLLRNRRGMIAASGLLMFVGTAGLVLPTNSGPVALLAAISAAGLGIGGLATFVRSLSLEMEGLGADLAGTAVGLIFAVGEVGGFAGPFVIGTLEDLTGSFAPGLAVTALAGLVTVAAAIPLTGVEGSP